MWLILELRADTSRSITPPLIWARVRKPLKCRVERSLIGNARVKGDIDKRSSRLQ
jgi:hypothetical protein